MQELWTNAIDRILDPAQTPLGSMDSLIWHQAEMMILHRAQQKPSKESLAKAFAILERLAQEAVNKSLENTTSDPPVKTMHIYLVHAILKSWNQLFRQKLDNTRPSTICKRMEDCLEKSKGRLFEPNIATYTIILDGATHCPDPKERVAFTESLLHRLLLECDEKPELRPTVVTFGTVIHALAKSGSPALAKKAEGWLRRLQQLHDAGWPEVAPNTVVYTQVIRGWASVGQAERAEALLQEMYRDSVLHGNEKVLPSLWTFNTVLTAWSKSNDPQCVSHAETLLHEMVEFSKDKKGPIQLTPDMISYNCMLSTIARRRKHPDALEKAEFWMEALLKFSKTAKTKKNAVPTRFTYNVLFNIIAATDIPNKAERAQYWLDKCEDRKLKKEKSLVQRIKDFESTAT